MYGLGAVPADKGVFSANIALFLYSRYRDRSRHTTEACVAFMNSQCSMARHIKWSKDKLCIENFDNKEVFAQMTNSCSSSLR